MIDPVIDDVFKVISENFHPMLEPISISFPSSRTMVEKAFDDLKAKGHPIYADDVKAAAIKNGWAPDEAEYLVKRTERYLQK